MVQGAKHMKSNNAADNGGSSPQPELQPKPQSKPKRRRKRLPRWADRLITIVIILIGVGLMTWPWILDRLEASGVFNQISTVSSTVDALSAEERERILLQARSFNEQLAGVQSGSTRILKEMNRRYTREDYLGLVDRIRNRMPDIALSTDIIVGFPGETEEDFEQTLSLAETVRYAQAYTFIYSKRAGTPAAEIEDPTPHEVILERFNRLVKVIETFVNSSAAPLSSSLPARLIVSSNDPPTSKSESRVSSTCLAR